MRVQTDISGTVTLDKKIIPDMFSDFFIYPELICNCQYLQFKKKVHSIVFSLIFDFIIFFILFLCLFRSPAWKCENNYTRKPDPHPMKQRL